jgi:hypothetical protein
LRGGVAEIGWSRSTADKMSIAAAKSPFSTAAFP